MTDTWLRRARRYPRLLDALLTLGLLVVTAGSTMTDRFGNHLEPDPAALTLAVLSSAAVLAHRRRPWAVLAATLVGGLAICFTVVQLTPGLIAPLVAALYFVAVHTDRTTARIATGVVAVLVTIVTAINEPDGPIGAKIGVVSWILLPGALGDSVRNRRAHLAAIEERAERAERTREEEARRRVADERIRIARDLHDVVAHHIALANAQAGIAVHLLDRHPAQAREMLSHLTDATGSALRELKATVGLLRRADDPEAPLEPAPGLGRLPDLLDSFERAGLPVRLTVEGEPQPLSPGVDLTAYRILQESLTNVAKHATGTAAAVTLTYTGSRVLVAVANDRPAARPRPTGPAGYGLIGMRERASAVGGRLTADHRPGGGFLVSAELPLRTAAAREDKDPR
ncbi:sensor histidine kinase [Streptomyces sp. BE20]|uniref:sensor histidine kinase n=1 Tax=Streptomycetaceae TaxID=2062 RepID=UPI002E764C1F|nr:sensor histidine kinase [Streptomyces sp. BE20]MEE1825034.1 sensor histidine kinase [Streptomyces sp. BE20]